MDNEKWADALNEISDEHLLEAADIPRRKNFPWFGALAGALAAAMLAVILAPLGFLGLLFQGAGSPSPGTIPPETTVPSGSIRAEVVNLAASPRNQSRVDKGSVYNQTKASFATRYDFFLESSRLLLSGKEENVLWSPVNAWLNLAMTARLTGGETRQELLDALGATDMGDLTRQSSTLWEALYVDEASGKCHLANSVWLDSACGFAPAAMEALAYDFYASIYRADLGTEEANADIRNWINENTGGLLQDAAQEIEVPENALIALYSTIYFQGRWDNEFHPNNSTESVFHTPAGDITCTFMNHVAAPMTYYWSDSFGAVSLGMRNGSSMWFILPDKGVSVDQILADDDYLMLIANRYDSVTGEYTWRDRVSIKINLSIPKFDIAGKTELGAMMQALGIEAAFDPETADFSQSLPESNAYLQTIRQAVRVAIDEEGVTAAAFTEMIAGAAPPPEEIMDFILDRPFLFVIERANVPLFVGVVNDPSAG